MNTPKPPDAGGTEGFSDSQRGAVGKGQDHRLCQNLEGPPLAGTCADGLAATLQISVGRGSALVILIAGILLSVTALCLLPLGPVRQLEKASA